jgi:hypothetical protein
MKITELFNNKSKNVDAEFELGGVGMNKKPDDHSGADDEYSFDLAEDLIYFMHNNDDFYRKRFFPVLNLCKKQFDQGQSFSHRVFRPIVTKAYSMYKDEFPLRELRDDLEKEMVEEICKKIHESEMTNMREGAYK